MSNHERIFSDSQTRRKIEDAFFNRAMSIYCENESRKIIEEMETGNTVSESNTAPLNQIFSKLKRQRNWHNTFRVAKKVTDRVAMLVLAAVIVFASAVTASADVRSSLADFTSRWSTFSNIAEEPFDLDGEDVKSFKVYYATVWNFDSDGTKNIAAEESVFGGKIVEAYGNYYINYTTNMDTQEPTICSANDYTIEYDENSSPIKGIVIKDESGIPVFYPYYNDNGDNLYMVCKRTEDNENIFSESTTLSLPDGSEAKVQPFSITLFMYQESDDPDLINKLFEKGDYVEAEIKMKNIFVSAYSMSEDDEIYGTRAVGSIDNLNYVNVIGVF